MHVNYDEWLGFLKISKNNNGSIKNERFENVKRNPVR